MARTGFQMMLNLILIIRGPPNGRSGMMRRLTNHHRNTLGIMSYTNMNARRKRRSNNRKGQNATTERLQCIAAKWRQLRHSPMRFTPHVAWSACDVACAAGKVSLKLRGAFLSKCDVGPPGRRAQITPGCNDNNVTQATRQKLSQKWRHSRHREKLGATLTVAPTPKWRERAFR